jgi:ABC-type lipoprotein export system ATPase subunit
VTVPKITSQLQAKGKTLNSDNKSKTKFRQALNTIAQTLVQKLSSRALSAFRNRSIGFVFVVLFVCL